MGKHLPPEYSSPPENALYAKGYRYVAGVDEVGRGPLAGPVVAAAVILPADHSIKGPLDSKRLSPTMRERSLTCPLLLVLGLWISGRLIV